MRTIREILFYDFNGCTNHNCIVTKRVGMGTNGSCSCLSDLSRTQIQIMKGRLSTIIDKEIKEK